VTGLQEADASAAGVGLAGATAFAGDRLEAAFFLLFAFPAGAFFTALRVFGVAAALAEVAAAARLAALLTFAHRAF
jgi:hypothetical protein